jgi:hypothetical protein
VKGPFTDIDTVFYGICHGRDKNYGGEEKNKIPLLSV